MKILIQELSEKLKLQKIEIEIDESAVEFIFKKGYNSAFGARPLKRAIEVNLVNPLSLMLIEGSVAEGDHVKVSVKEANLDFEVT